jgi:transposase
MAKPTTLFLGLDVHKDFITVAHAEAHRSDPPVFIGSIGSRQADIEKVVRRFHSKAAHLVFAYEAGPSRPIAWVHKRDKCSFLSSK